MACHNGGIYPDCLKVNRRCKISSEPYNILNCIDKSEFKSGAFSLAWIVKIEIKRCGLW